MDKRPETKKGIIDRIIPAVLAAVLVISLGGAARDIWNYEQSKKVYADLNAEAVTDTPPADDYENTDADETNPYANLEAPEIDFDSLLAKDGNVKAWLTMPAVGISYPVLYSGDDSYYLHRTLGGSYLYAGSLFLEGLNRDDFSDPNTFIYGHNMKNGTMFAKLKKYRDEDTYNLYPCFWINTPDGSVKLYHIFSVHETQSKSETYQLFSQHDASYLAWAEQEKSLSEVPTDDPLDKNVDIVTLSTCGVHGTSERYVVDGVLVYEKKK